MRRAYAAFGALGVLTVVVGLGATVASGRPASPATPSPSAPVTTSSGAPDGRATIIPYAFAPTVAESSPQSELSIHNSIRQLVAGLDPSEFVSVTLGPPPTGSERNGNWLYLKLAVPSSDSNNDTQQLWEADLLQGDLAELIGSDSDLGNSIAGSTIQLDGSDGSTAEAPSGSGDIARGQVFRTLASPAQLVTDAMETIRSFGLQPNEVRLLHPLSYALSVIATVPDLSKTDNLATRLSSALLGSPYEFEGLYLELRDPSGSVLFQGSSAFRSGVTRVHAGANVSLTGLGVGHG